MSFSNNCSKIDKIPGPINGNALNGICEKACIEVKKVFDACIKQETMQNVTLKVVIEDESKYTKPYKFISAKSSGPAEIEELVVTPSDDDPCFARIRCNVVVPLTVLFVDANGVEGYGTTTMVIPKDVMLHVSAPSLIPYEIEVFASVICPTGAFVYDDIVVSACTTVVMKVVMPVDLLVPTYGYCYIPPCQEYSEETCGNIFELPLYPQECGVEGRCKRC